MKQYQKLILAALLIFMSVPLTGCINGPGAVSGEAGSADVPPLVEQWRPDVSHYAAIYQVTDYVELLLAIIAQESGGDSQKYSDVMQSSESAGLEPNTITDPKESIDQGIRYFCQILKAGQEKQVDMDTIIQSYNFGGGFIDYIAENHSGRFNQQAAKDFSRMMCGRLGWSNYGDVLYVEHVRRYIVDSSNANGIDDFFKLEEAMLEFEGVPYLWGGNSMEGVDCSGLTTICYRAIGVTLPRTSQAQYDSTCRIRQSQAKPGDLVFFKNTNSNSQNLITHVGVYVGDGRMFDASSKGCGYSSITSSYYAERLVGFGRVR